MNLWLYGRKLIFLPAWALGLCLVLGGGGTRLCAASFTVSIHPATITLGQNATLSLTFENGTPQQVPMPPVVPGLQITYVGPSSQFSFINGQVSQTVTHNFTVTPRKAGQFVIPALTAEVNGQRLRSQPVKLTVLPPNTSGPAAAASRSQVAFLRLVLPKKRIYLHEVMVGRLDLYLRQDVRNYGNFRLNGLPADGFSTSKLVQGPQRQVQLGNVVYTVIPIEFALTAQRTGPLKVGPVTASVVVALPSQNNQNNPFNQFGFSDPFNMFGGQQRRVSLAAGAVAVQSQPLPTHNAPANFNGAVGQFTLRVKAGPTNVAVGDPITVRVAISGRGQLDTLSLPRQPAWHDFTTYPPTSKLKTTDQFGVEGTKTFEEIVSPKNTDVHELPRFAFSYFDPEAKSFRTLTAPPVPLAVKAGGLASAPVIAAASAGGGKTAPPPQAIAPIKQRLGVLAQVGPPLVSRPWFLAAQGLPVCAWLAALVWRRRSDKLANNPRLRRRRRVAQLVQTGTGELRQFAKQNNGVEFFARLFHLLQEVVGERLDRPAASVTEAVIEEGLQPRGAPPPLLQALHELFQDCNQARYAPVRGTQELDAIAAQFESVARQLQTWNP